MSTELRLKEVMRELEMKGDPEARKGMARYGIATDRAFGVSLPTIRAMARALGKDHELALALWSTGNHEARILAPMIEEPSLVTEQQAEEWVADFDSWDVCDQCCSNLLDRTPFAYPKAREWSDKEKEFVRRAGFTLMAVLAVHDKKAGDHVFIAFLPLIEQGASDERNYVKKAVNWALRQIGKRDLALNAAAIACAERIQAYGGKAARWIASDALRELRGEAVQERLKNRIKGRTKSPL